MYNTSIALKHKSVLETENNDIQKAYIVEKGLENFQTCIFTKYFLHTVQILTFFFCLVGILQVFEPSSYRSKDRE